MTSSLKAIFRVAGLIVLTGVLLVPASRAQQRLAYVDSDLIMSRIPDYATVQQQLDRIAQEWQQELEQKRREVDELFREYQTRELLYTNEERQRKREEIMRADDELERLRVEYFGPEGELFRQQERLVRPIQERVLAAIDDVATREGYDFVFDRAGDFLFLYAREQYDLSDEVLQTLGIDVDTQVRSSQ